MVLFLLKTLPFHRCVPVTVTDLCKKMLPFYSVFYGFFPQNSDVTAKGK